MGLAMAVAVGAGVLVVNQTFVDLWMGPRLYGGTTLNVLLVALAVVTVVIRVDTMVVDACLGFRARSSVTLVGAVIGLLAGLVLGRADGLVGATIGLLIGRVLVAVAMPVLVAHATDNRIDAVVRPLVRPALAGATVLAATAVVGGAVSIPGSWAAVVAVAAVSACVAGGAFALLGIDRGTRRDLVARMLLLAGRGPRVVTEARPA